MDNDNSADHRIQKMCQSLPGFNVTQALIRLDGDHDLYIRILRSYEHSFKDFSNTLRKLAESGDADQMIQQLHTLKGAAANLEITQVHQLSQSLEDRLRQGFDLFTLPEYPSFTAALEASLEQIADLDDMENENTDKIASIDELMTALHELEAMLSDYDAGAGNRFVRVKPALIRLGLSAEASRLEKATSRYAFDEARIVCNTIIQSL